MSVTDDTEPTPELATTSSEVMAQDAHPVAKPAGSPDLWPFPQLPRRTRAKFLRAFGDFEATSTAVDPAVLAAGGDAPDAQVSLNDAAALFDLMADLEDALRHTAVDAAQFDAWAAACDDNDLAELSNWYMARFQVGEAPASST